MPLLQVLPAQIPNHVAKLRAACLEGRQQQRQQQQHRVVRQPSGSQSPVAGVGPGRRAAKASENESGPVMAMAAVLRPSEALAEPIPAQATVAHLPAMLAELVVPAGALGTVMLSQRPAVLAEQMSVTGRAVASQLPAMSTEPVPAKAMLPRSVSRLRWPG